MRLLTPATSPGNKTSLIHGTSRRDQNVVFDAKYEYTLVYLNGNNAAEGENNIKYANSYPMN